MNDVIHPEIAARREALGEAVRAAKFFPHAAIDRFFTDEICRGLVDEFPRFRDQDALNEMGKVGQKACREDVHELGETFARVDDCMRSADFLQLMSKITGIPNLLYDPEYAGGGTHDNIDGAQLDIHVDFNSHPTLKWHRRLNLIVFLTPEWDADWGGCFEVHKNPWSPQDDELESFAPRLNRAVIFETSEVSWHGFNRIMLPEGKRHLSRKSFAIYLYTESRPAEQLAPSHATIYVPPPVPKHIQAGATLSDVDADYLRTLVTRRDQQIKFLYDREMEFSQRLETLSRIVRERLPLKGYVQQVGEAEGMWEDLWIGERFELRVRNDNPIANVIVYGYVPDDFPPARPLIVEIGDVVFEQEIGVGPFQAQLQVAIEAQVETRVRIRCPETFNLRRAGVGSDIRDLGYLLSSILFY